MNIVDFRVHFVWLIVGSTFGRHHLEHMPQGVHPLFFLFSHPIAVRVGPFNVQSFRRVELIVFRYLG